MDLFLNIYLFKLLLIICRILLNMYYFLKLQIIFFFFKHYFISIFFTKIFLRYRYFISFVIKSLCISVKLLIYFCKFLLSHKSKNKIKNSQVNNRVIFHPFNLLSF